jgi:hypothetical protein
MVELLQKKIPQFWRIIGLVLFKEGVYKFSAVEKLQVTHLFTHPDKLNGDFELVGDTDDYAAFGSSIQFGDG